jgi:hypothetical protein
MRNRFTLPTLLAAIAICGTLAACDGVVTPDQPAAAAAAPSAAAPRGLGLVTGGYQATGLITGGYQTTGDQRSQGLLSGGY